MAAPVGQSVTRYLGRREHEEGRWWKAPRVSDRRESPSSRWARRHDPSWWVQRQLGAPDLVYPERGAATAPPRHSLFPGEWSLAEVTRGV